MRDLKEFPWDSTKGDYLSQWMLFSKNPKEYSDTEYVEELKQVIKQLDEMVDHLEANPHHYKDINKKLDESELNTIFIINLDIFCDISNLVCLLTTNDDFESIFDDIINIAEKVSQYFLDQDRYEEYDEVKYDLTKAEHVLSAINYLKTNNLLIIK